MISLRIIGIALLLLSLFEPILSFERVISPPPQVAILVDTSASMGVEDISAEGDNPSAKMGRLSAASELLSGERGLLRRLENKGHVELYSFSDGLVSIPSLEDAQLIPGGGATDIAGAIKDISQGKSLSTPSAIIVLSDGVHNSGSDPLEMAKLIDLPIYTIGLGRSQTPKDLSIDGLGAPEITFVDEPLKLKARLINHGFGEEPVELVLKREGQELGRYPFKIGEGVTEVDVPFIAEELGDWRYSLSVSPQKDELTDQNNEWRFATKVIKSKIKVLYIDGHPRHEVSFLGRALSGDENIDLKTYIKIGPNLFLSRAEDGEGQTSDLEVERKRINRYDVVILGNLRAEELPTSLGEELVDFVGRNKGAFLMLGGSDSFGAGGYNGSPIGKMLPFTMEGDDRFIPTTYFLRLTPEGKVHPAMRLSEKLEDNEIEWRKLPSLKGLNEVGQIKPGATVLALNSQTDTPLVVWQRFGNGRVITILADSTWRWDFLMWGLKGDNGNYLQFWRGMVRHLALGEERGLISLYTQSNRYNVGDKVDIKVKVYDENYHPVDGFSPSVTLEDGADARKVPMTALGDGEYVGEIELSREGAYTLKASAHYGGKILAQSEKLILSEIPQLEMKEVRLNESLLTEIAQTTGGRYYNREDAGRLASELVFKEKVATEKSEIRIGRGAEMFLAFVVLLSAEWLLRRRKGLS